MNEEDARDEIRQMQSDAGELADRLRPEHPAVAGFLEGVHDDLREAEDMLTDSEVNPDQ